MLRVSPAGSAVSELRPGVCRTMLHPATPEQAVMPAVVTYCMDVELGACVFWGKMEPRPTPGRSAVAVGAAPGS
eukprot:scaffold6770_cov229-Prasinococcus_capsulatus_cf.AAC.1